MEVLKFILFVAWLVVLLFIAGFGKTVAESVMQSTIPLWVQGICTAILAFVWGFIDGWTGS